MKINTQVIYELNKANKIDDKFFDTIISTTDLPLSLIKDTSTGFVWGEWTRTARLIEELALEMNYFDNFKLPTDNELLFNLFYFFPSFAVTSNSTLVDKILQLSMNKYMLMLENPVICEFIKNGIPDHDLKESFSSKYIYTIWAIHKHELLTYDEETKLLRVILSKIEKDSAFQFFIKKRLKVLNESRVNISDSGSNRCALLISGQFRFDDDIEDILTAVFDNKSINVTEVFVSSWIKIGGMDGFNDKKILRYLDSEVIAKVKSGHIDIKDINVLINDNNNFLDEGNIATKICKPSYLRLNNEEEYPYNHMTNSEKMYFNNAYWVNTLGKEYFINNFDYILKVRPDIVFDKFNFDFASLKKNTVLAEEGWIFRGWGFGIGDQILVGRSGPMVEILSCHSDKALKDLTTTLYPNSSGFMGHVNLGISAWSKNIMVGKLTDFKHHLKSPPKISIQNIYSKELK